MSRSSARSSSRSPRSTSIMLPSETTREKPTERSAAQSSIAATIAPDCDTNARSPARGVRCAKLALTPRAGAMNPMQLGPMMRRPRGRAASSTARSSAAPSGPRSRNPADRMTAARAPRSASWRTISGTVGAGVAITARSGASGRLATSRWTGTPCRDSRRGCTGRMGPSKPAPNRLAATARPTEPSRSLGPINAIERGEKKASKPRRLTPSSYRSPAWRPAR